MNRTGQISLHLVTLVALLGLGYAGAAEVSNPSTVDSQPKKASQPQAVPTPQVTAPTRAEALARIAKLGGHTYPEKPTSKDPIEYVFLRRTQAADADLRLLAALPNVINIDLSNTKITNDGLKHLIGMKKLRVLRLRNTLVTIEGLLHLKNLPQLSTLDMTGTKLKESDLARLKGMKSLRWLSPFPNEVVKAQLIDQELQSTDWATSGDKALSLRLLALKRPYGLSEAVVLLAELRNNSKQERLVLRPFGDKWRVRMKWLAIRGPKGRCYYAGPRPSYLLGKGTLSVLGPGRIIWASLGSALKIENSESRGLLFGVYFQRYRLVLC